MAGGMSYPLKQLVHALHKANTWFNWKRFQSIAWETNHNTITSVISHISQLQQGIVLSNKKSSQFFSLIFHWSRVYIK